MEKTKKLTTQKIVNIGVLSSISIVLGLTPLGMIPLPTVNATILHIPVILGAILQGPLVGFFVGLIFGIFSLLKALSNPGASILTFALINPLVSVLPRIFIGIGSYYTYIGILGLFKNKKSLKQVAIAFGTAVGTLINTVGVLGMIYIFYGDKLIEKMQNIESMKNIPLKAFFLGIVFSNGIAEVVVAIILVLILTKVAFVIKK